MGAEDVGWPKLPQFLVKWVKQQRPLITIAAAASCSLDMVDNSALKPILLAALLTSSPLALPDGNTPSALFPVLILTKQWLTN